MAPFNQPSADNISPNVNLGAAVNQATPDLSCRCNTYSLTTGYCGLFTEDPGFTMWLEEPDPLVIDCDEENCGYLETSVPCVQFRVPSHSFGAKGIPRIRLRQLSDNCWTKRRACSEGNLSVGPVQKIVTICPCEMVQGVSSHPTCQKIGLSIPDTCCFTCGSDWEQDHTAWACFECGGYGLVRPCITCNGKCGEHWIRDLKLTHVTGVANWIGNCPRQESDENSVAPHDSLKTTTVVPMLAS